MSHSSQNRSSSPVLLIEDDNTLRESLEMLLELKGYEVIAARNGKEGLQLLEEHGEVCLIVLDWMMPVMSGRDFLDVVSEHEAFGHIPVIVVSGFAGFDKTLPVDYLSKPIDTAALISKIRTQCS
ncbi:response regulator [Persicimonas caeni]|uniref:Response regulator n=1 Tax=Persicimonas caeni TaxID=2292766 RepID=A0A4Y6PXN0_PERCE|nr:response regulator [Persicimonas caeni]QDG53098.1 response regulator [Persicimonas caeni]QED34320.1 response regulator [Persicimonas caeni]